MHHGVFQIGPQGSSRIDQLVEWCGRDYDGLILYDECHKVRRATLSKPLPVLPVDGAGCLQMACVH